MQEIRDEVIAPLVGAIDPTAIYFDLINTAGYVSLSGVKLVLKNPVIETGTPANKALLTDFLAASGTTEGTGSALTLNQAGFVLFDGATVRIKLHAALIKGATLNITSKGAKNITDMKGRSVGGQVAGSWITLIYSATTENFMLQGEGGVVQRYNNEAGHVSTFELMMNNFNPYYGK